MAPYQQIFETCLILAVLKNKYEDGGLKITDIDCLNRLLKLRQFIRANTVYYPIKIIQPYCLEILGYKGNVVQEYEKLSSKETVIKSAQTTINWCFHGSPF